MPERESMQDVGEVTVLLKKWGEGRDREALNEALPHLLTRMRQLARHYLARESPGHTLQPTALVHEAYLRLLECQAGKIESRSQFFAYSARLMRQILIDHARSRAAVKRGDGMEKVAFSEAIGRPHLENLLKTDVLALDEAVQALGRIDRRQRQIAELRYYVGLTVEEVAQVLEISVATVNRDWEAARRWLAATLTPPRT